eukprot:4127706-Prymnesium_polylepis.1
MSPGGGCGRRYRGGDLRGDHAAMWTRCQQEAAQGVAVVVVTLGKDGAIAKSGGGQVFRRTPARRWMAGTSRSWSDTTATRSPRGVMLP